MTFTDLVGCSAPIQQAPMGGVTSTELVAAVCQAGGLGMLSAGANVTAAIDAVRSVAGDRPVGVNFLAPFFGPAAAESVAGQARVIEWFWAQPDPSMVEVAHDGGSLACWQVGSAEEARMAADAGCDMVVAQGCEAGGHVRGTVGLLPLLDSVLTAVSVPVIAAGGIATGRGVAAVLAAGASAARVGTRFVATVECTAHPDYQQAVVSAKASDTVLTEAYSLGWPEAPHRVLRSAVDAATVLGEDTAGEVAGRPVPKWSVMPPNRDVTGQIGAMALYAGQSVGAIDEVLTVAEVMKELTSRL